MQILINIETYSHFVIPIFISKEDNSKDECTHSIELFIESKSHQNIYKGYKWLVP